MSADTVAPLRPPIAIPDRLIGAFIRGFNHVLTQHAWARRELTEHAGRLLAVRLHSPLGEFTAKVAIDGDGRLVNPAVASPVDAADKAEPIIEPAPAVTVRVPIEPALLLSLLRDGQQAAMRQVHVEGEAGLAATIGRLAPHLRWDIEDDLSRMVGDVAARRITATARAVLGGLRDLRTRVESHAVSHWVYEDPQLVARAQFDEFMRGLRDLRDGLARAEQRLDRLA